MYISQPVYPGVGNKQITNKRFDLVRNRAHICHGYHGLYPWRKNCHMEKFQLSMYDNCGKTENFSTCGEILGNFATIYALSSEVSE